MRGACFRNTLTEITIALRWYILFKKEIYLVSMEGIEKLLPVGDNFFFRHAKNTEMDVL